MGEQLVCKGIKVLVVDDVQANIDLMKVYLEILGCEVDCALNGMEAIEKIKTNPYDLCLMDIMMPVMTGIEATKIIRCDVSENLPIVAVTGSREAENRKKCFDSGMNDYITKPIDLEVLKIKILEHVRIL
ncbi:hypothetical protein MNBD_BACTEROID05-616 [hydrothermal vent metagenome]|uniref:Response regulatory domain-containing protein n=1 Tax=hydrothermal vent metagenome TaxID=652676 RepID=A0A3B0TRA8_9ZZZZ